jgi:hypothetical protein
LISRPPKVLTWAKTAIKRAGKRFGPAQAKEIRPLTLIDSDFYRIGKAVSSNLKVQPDVLVGITPAWIAGVDENRRVFFDFFSSTQAHMAIVTTTDMRRSAEKAGRPIEVAVALTVVAQVLVGLNRDLHFHEHKNRVYCLFDIPDIDQWIRIVRRPAVEGRCLDRMKPAHREALLRILEALDKYKRPELAATALENQENAG